MPSTPIRSPRSSEVERLERLVAEHVLARVHLDPAGAVDQVEEGGAAVPAAGGQPAGDAVGGVGLLARLEVAVRGVDGRDRHDALERVRERVDPLLAQALELRRGDRRSTGGSLCGEAAPG